VTNERKANLVKSFHLSEHVPWSAIIVCVRMRSLPLPLFLAFSTVSSTRNYDEPYT